MDELPGDNIEVFIRSLELSYTRKTYSKIIKRKAYRSEGSWWVHPGGSEGCWIRTKDEYILEWSFSNKFKKILNNNLHE